MNRYKNLSIQETSIGDYALVPIRMQDRECIRVWRNQQMYHLRQQQALTVEQQEAYFETVVAKLFEESEPKQLLFSYLHQGECIGYGGLVHIDYQKKSAELSFIMNTELEIDAFETHWTNYLQLIEPIAFNGLQLNKIYTYAFDLRPHLYPVLIKNGFLHERIIPNALIENEQNISAQIHSKWNAKLRLITQDDRETTYQWAINPAVRKYAFQESEITRAIHENWFMRKLEDKHCFYYLLESASAETLGSIRFDIDASETSIHHGEQRTALISYLIDPSVHGQGWGLAILVMGEESAKYHGIQCLIGEVKPENTSSCAIFAKLGYESEIKSDRIRFKKSL